MNDGVMIAFLPTNGYWCKQDLPHMTLVYCGTMDDVSYGGYNDLAKDAISVARIFRRPFSLDVTGVEVFGDDSDKVDVLTLATNSKIELARKLVERWNKSDKPFTPHATIGPEGSAEGILPTGLIFDRIIVQWGPKQMTFMLGDSPDVYRD